MSKLFMFLAVLVMAAPARGVDYPDASPGEARGGISATAVVLQNEAIAMHWTIAEGRLKPERVEHVQHSTFLSLAESECFQLVIGNSPDLHSHLVKASELLLVGAPRLERVEPHSRAIRPAEQVAGWQVSARLASAVGDFEVLWRAVLRDGSNYIRQEIVVDPGSKPIEVEEVVALEVRVPGAQVAGRVDGSPVVAEVMFFGVEHPAATNAVFDTDTVRCSYPFGKTVTAAEPLMLRSVIGVVPTGQLRRGFLYYLERERAHPYRPFLHHNNGEAIGMAYWSLVASKKITEAKAFRLQQKQIWQDLIDKIGRELVERRGAQVDAFAYDYGWDDEHVVWRFHEGFPDGFRPLIDIASGYGSKLGIWFSPWGGYPGKGARLQAGREQGFEINQGGLSLAGPRYYDRFQAACLHALREHGVTYFKFDGFAGSNSPAGAGEYRSDVEALWRLLGELREADPKVFINPSSGTWASPFWLLRADSIWRGGGDAGVAGAKGSERQQWITYRDFEVYDRVRVNGPLYPISSLMIHGVMINGGGRVKSFDEQDMVDEIHSFFATGVNLQELYISPELMTPAAWDALAEAAIWSRTNADVLADTHWVGGDPSKGEIYGWASWAARKGILSLRNPSDKPAEIVLDIGQLFELPHGATQAYSFSSPWKRLSGRGSQRPPTSDGGVAPQNSRPLGAAPDAAPTLRRLAAGERHTFALQPFEVLTLEAMPE